jgi:DNA-directed RNA polymerase subunit RPC12/RpoP
MQCNDIAPSCLPSLMVPCPYCGHRMEITAVTHAEYPNGTASNGREDITHTCVQCGATLTSTRQPTTPMDMATSPPQLRI